MRSVNTVIGLILFGFLIVGPILAAPPDEFAPGEKEKKPDNVVCGDNVGNVAASRGPNSPGVRNGDSNPDRAGGGAGGGSRGFEEGGAGRGNSAP